MSGPQVAANSIKENTNRDNICYHHFSLTFNADEVSTRFEDVRFVLVAGCQHRAEAQANYLASNLLDDGRQHELEKLTGPVSRFVLFKIGPILVSNHGMGSASASIALHELFLMCQQAGILDNITLIRFGTCGGIGVAPGTVCITNRALDSLFRDYVELKICMKLVRRPCTVDQKTASTYENLAKMHPNRNELGDYEIKMGATVASNDFYEEQGRTNGAICEHSQADKIRFLEKAQELGVINMEMESNYMAAMCHKLGVSFAVVCVALNNRLLEDKVKLSRPQMSIFEKRLFWLNLVFIKHKLSLDKPANC